ncbi:MAG: class I tRNA ligase family protein, partial [Candidatus Omnitrophota bacterium]
IDYNSLEEIDKWAIMKVYKLQLELHKYYEEFQFYKVYQGAYNFCIDTLSSFYLDILKDRLYTYASNSQQRRSAQTALYEIIINLTKMIAPILVFTAEEIWQNILHKENDESIHLSVWPKVDKRIIDNNLDDNWSKIMTLRKTVLKKIEEKRALGAIGSSLETQITLFCKDKKEYEFLEKYLADLPAIFIVSGVNLKLDPEIEEKCLVEKASGNKCNRCWNYSVSVGENSKYPDLCQKCLVKGGF